jgi:hypothetical protein
MEISISAAFPASASPPEDGWPDERLALPPTLTLELACSPSEQPVPNGSPCVASELACSRHAASGPDGFPHLAHELAGSLQDAPERSREPWYAFPAAAFLCARS